MARIAPSTFEQRLARIDQRASSSANAYQKEHLVQSTKKKRRVHWDMLIFGAMAGGVAGTLFAMNVGLLLLTSVDAFTLYQMVLVDYVKAVLILGVAIAPVGFVMSQIFARSNPRGWQFWIGYLAAVLGANSGDIQTYYYMLTSAPV